MFQRMIVVGGSSGIGEAIVRQAAQAGASVAVVGRNEARLIALANAFQGRVHPIVHDVLELGDVESAFLRCTDALGGLDCIVYSAGVMPEVGPEEFDTEKDALMMRVNVIGAMAWLNLAARRFQSVKAGTIVGIGSVAGDRGRRGQPAYNASKAALHTYLEALRNRLAGQGITVVTIKPGPTRTPMTEHLRLKGLMDVDQAARLILSKSRRGGEHYLKLSHRVIFGVIRAIPSPIFRRLPL